MPLGKHVLYFILRTLAVNFSAKFSAKLDAGSSPEDGPGNLGGAASGFAHLNIFSANHLIS